MVSEDNEEGILETIKSSLSISASNSWNVCGGSILYLGQPHLIYQFNRDER